MKHRVYVNQEKIFIRLKMYFLLIKFRNNCAFGSHFINCLIVQAVYINKKIRLWSFAVKPDVSSGNVRLSL